MVDMFWRLPKNFSDVNHMWCDPEPVFYIAILSFGDRLQMVVMFALLSFSRK